MEGTGKAQEGKGMEAESTVPPLHSSPLLFSISLSSPLLSFLPPPLLSSPLLSSLNMDSPKGIER